MPAASGGGLSTPGVVTIESSTLDGNNAPLGGAGVFGNLEINIGNSTISNNLGGGVSTGVSSESNVNARELHRHRQSQRRDRRGDLQQRFGVARVLDGGRQHCGRGVLEHRQPAAVELRFGRRRWRRHPGQLPRHADVVRVQLQRRRQLRLHPTHRPAERRQSRASARWRTTADRPAPCSPPPPARSSTRSRPRAVRPTAPPVSPPTSAGITRPQGTGCDIGAVEAQIVVPVVPPVPLTPAQPAPIAIAPSFTG